MRSLIRYLPLAAMMLTSGGSTWLLIHHVEAIMALGFPLENIAKASLPAIAACSLTVFYAARRLVKRFFGVEAW